MLRILTLALVAVSLAGAQTDPNQLSEQDVQLFEKYQKDYLSYHNMSINELKNEVTDGIKPEDVKFVFYNAPAYGDVVSGDLLDASFPLAYTYKTDYETIFYIHGWLQRDDPETYKYAALQYGIRGKRINFISVDWSRHSRYLYLLHFSVFDRMLPKIAEYVSQMVQRLTVAGVDPKRIHMIGFDAGAHIAGLAGKKLEQKVDRITGLSPLGLYYNRKNESERLSKGDANFVDVIHTNTALFGISKPIGDVDFFPAGGRKQPAANKWPILGDIASHLMARDYYMESIDLGFSFVGKRCSSWLEFVSRKCLFKRPEIMGEYNTRNVRGNVYLNVNAAEPYGLGVAGEFPDEEEQQQRQDKQTKQN